MSIERIRRLIALAGSENEHEARSAAYLACKLIREGKFEIADPAAAPRDVFEAWPWPTSPVDVPRRPPAGRQPRDTRPRRRVPCDVGRAPRSGLCAVCAEGFESGDHVANPILAADAHLGTAHADCRSRWTAPDDG